MQRRRLLALGQSEVLDVAAEEGRPLVQALVHKGELIWHRREQGLVGDGALDTVEARTQSRAVGPVRVGVGRAVHGEDNVDIPDWLDQGVKRDILQILTTVHEAQLGVIGSRVPSHVPAVEGIRHVPGNVVLVGAQILESLELRLVLALALLQCHRTREPRAVVRVQLIQHPLGGGAVGGEVLHRRDPRTKNAAR